MEYGYINIITWVMNIYWIDVDNAYIQANKYVLSADKYYDKYLYYVIITAICDVIQCVYWNNNIHSN